MKPHDIDVGIDALFSDEGTAPPSPSSSRGGETLEPTTGFKKRWADQDWSDDGYWGDDDVCHDSVVVEEEEEPCLVESVWRQWTTWSTRAQPQKPVDSSLCSRGYYGVLDFGEEEEDDEEVCITGEEGGEVPSLRRERTTWSGRARSQPRKQGMVRDSRGRRTTTRNNKKRRCPRHIRDRRRGRALRRKQLVRRARVGGRRRRLPVSFRGGGDPPQGDQVCSVLVSRS